MKRMRLAIALWLSATVATAQSPAHAPAPAPTAAPTAPTAVGNPTHVSHGRFKDVAVYLPPTTPSSFVLFLSSTSGWNAEAQIMAQQLAQQGAMVAGIDLPAFMKSLEADAGQCVFPDGDLENLSHFLQAYFHGSTYLAPMLVGVAAGATLAYAVLAQAPRDTFAGAVTLDFCPTLPLRKALCRGSGIEFSPIANGSGVDVRPIANLGNPWVTLQRTTLPNCAGGKPTDFVGKIRGAALAELPDASSKPFTAAFAKLVASRTATPVAAPPAALSGLPIIEVAARPGSARSDFFAILMSGDGGWAGLDQDIAAALTAQGIPVVGLDSLRYYWTARTPDGLAADTDRMIRYYLSHFDKKKVLLIGYSQGADVLPFAVNRLPAATHALVALTAILGMSEHALFEFHLSSWLADDTTGPATLPEVNRITGMPVLCIYGEDEHDSLCPKLDAKKFILVEVKGGHHFDGNYAALAQRIIAAATSQAASAASPASGS